MNEKKYNIQMNRIAINCYAVLAICMSVIYMVQVIRYNTDVLYCIFYTIIAVGPLIMTYIVNVRQGGGDLSIKYFLAVSFLIFYAFAVFTDETNLSILYIVPMVSILTIYTDLSLLATMYFIALLINAIYLVMSCASGYVDGNFVLNYILQLVCIIASGVFLFCCGQNQKQHIQLLKDNALKDELTGAYNRKFIEYKQEEIFQTGEKNNGVSFTAIDIDDFKHFNSTYGHDLGDKVLKTLSDTIQNEIKEYSGLYLLRIGGDEFVILSSILPYRVFVDVMDDIRENIAQTEILYNSDSVKINISMGCANTKNDHINTYLDLYKKADERLYQAKTGGKNMVITK